MHNNWKKEPPLPFSEDFERKNLARSLWPLFGIKPQSSDTMLKWYQAIGFSYLIKAKDQSFEN